MERQLRFILSLFFFIVGCADRFVAGQESSQDSVGPRPWLIMVIVVMVFVAVISLTICLMRCSAYIERQEPPRDGFDHLRDRLGIPRQGAPQFNTNVLTSPHSSHYNRRMFFHPATNNHPSSSTNTERPIFFGPIECVDNSSLFSGPRYGSTDLRSAESVPGAPRSDGIQRAVPDSCDKNFDEAPPPYESVVFADETKVSSTEESQTIMPTARTEISANDREVWI